MTYSDKINGSKALLTAIQALNDNEYVVVEYGVNYKGEPMRYRLQCSQYGSQDKKSYRVHRDEVMSLSGMNIEKFSKTTAYAYTYDLMNTRTTYNFPLYAMKLVEQPFLEVSHNEKFGV